MGDEAGVREVVEKLSRRSARVDLKSRYGGDCDCDWGLEVFCRVQKAVGCPVLRPMPIVDVGRDPDLGEQAYSGPNQLQRMRRLRHHHSSCSVRGPNGQSARYSVRTFAFVGTC
jgi:hypothetical protein